MNRVIRARVLSFAVLVSVLFAAGSAWGADNPLVQGGRGMGPSLFRPSVDTKGHFTVDSTPVLPHLNISLGLMLDFGFHQWMAVEQEDDAYALTMVDSYITTRLMFNLGLWDRLVVGLQLPVVIPSGEMYNGMDGDEPIREGWSSKGSFGDIAVHTKIHLTRANLHAVGVGLLVQYELPTGKPELLTGEPGGAISGKLIFDIEPVKWYRLAVNLGGRYPFKAEEENFANNDVPNMLLFKHGPTVSWGVGQSFALWPNLMDFVIEFYGNQMASEFGNMAYMSLEANLGFKLYIEESSYLLAGYAHGIPTGETDKGYGYQSLEHRMFLGFAFEPSMPDRDGDGIPDAEDACPDDPEDKDGFEDSDGCPDKDNDKDGIPDTLDSCPLVPEDFDGDSDTDGCPEEIPADPDIEASEDSDNDRIPDANDKCPDAPENYNGHEDEDGCPDKGDVELKGNEIKTLKKIYFEYNSAVIKQESYKILDTITAAIANNPQITFIEIQGHADERGPNHYNLKLTTKRAAAVKKYLVGKGIDKDRLRSVGYGEYCPIRKDKTEEAYEENRRVEFIILEISGQSNGVDPACKRAKRKGIGRKRGR